MAKCAFCLIFQEGQELLVDNELFYAIYDSMPVSKGHALIVPKQHIVSFFDLSFDQVQQLFETIKMTKKIIEEEFHPDAFNIGINEGREAGRTIDHLSVHLIPRYAGDSLVLGSGIRSVLGKKLQ